MEFQNYKCSVHKDVDASKYCIECNSYFCNKCEKHHSEILKAHHIFPSDLYNDELFTGFCKEKNHKNELYYFCKSHNQLCCSSCISKIKTGEVGKHFNCEIYKIDDIYDEKKKNLSNNIKNLDNLSNLYQSFLNESKQIIEEIDINKEKIKIEIQNIFTKIRQKLNYREDQLLIEVDNIFERKFNIENIVNIIKDKKYHEKIKIYLEKGKIYEKDLDKNENKIFLVNDCINIEKTLEQINNINRNLEKFKKQDKNLNFNCQPDKVINLIENLGDFYGEKINDQEVNITINNYNPQNVNYIKQISSNFGCCENAIYDCICFFESRNNEYILGYPDSSFKSIIFYDINNNKENKKFNNAHEQQIYTIKHYLYEYDMILSTSYNNDIKIWNFKEGLNILTISKIFEFSNNVYSSCIVFNGNNFNIFCTGDNDHIKLFSAKGKFIQNIGNEVKYRFYIDSSEIDKKKYLLVGGKKGIEVYNYPGLTEYYTFKEGNDTSSHNEAKITKINDTYNLIDTGSFNSIRIWDFLNKILLSKIPSDNTSVLRGFIIINNRYLLIGSQDNNIKEFDIEKKIMIKSITKHSNYSVGIKPVKDKNGNLFIVSYGCDKNIYLWGFN